MVRSADRHASRGSGMDEGRRSGTRRRPSHGSRILIRAQTRTSDTVAGVQSTFPQLRAGRWSSGFLPADALDASRSDGQRKAASGAGGNPVVCHRTGPPVGRPPEASGRGGGLTVVEPVAGRGDESRCQLPAPGEVRRHEDGIIQEPDQRSSVNGSRATSPRWSSIAVTSSGRENAI